MFSLSDYSFHLPPELIAETAANPAHNARLLVASIPSGKIISEKIFADLPEFLPKDSVLFFNNSKVIRARLPLRNQEIIVNQEKKNISD